MAAQAGQLQQYFFDHSGLLDHTDSKKLNLVSSNRSNGGPPVKPSQGQSLRNEWNEWKAVWKSEVVLKSFGGFQNLVRVPNIWYKLLGLTIKNREMVRHAKLFGMRPKSQNQLKTAQCDSALKPRLCWGINNVFGHLFHLLL
jgi:hypothetical protein